MQVSSQPFLSTAECVSKSLSIFGSPSELLEWDNTYSAQEDSVKLPLSACENPPDVSIKGQALSDYFRVLLCSVASCLVFGYLPVCLSTYLPAIVLSVRLSVHLCLCQFVCQLPVSHPFYCSSVCVSVWVCKWISGHPLFLSQCSSSVLQVFQISSVFFRGRNHFNLISDIYTNTSYEAKCCFPFKGWVHVHLKEIYRQSKVLCYNGTKDLWLPSNP